jgi:hypothetical protein
MNIRAGGFLLQALTSIPFLEATEETDNVKFEKIILNGLAGFYWIIRKNHDREFALRKLMMFLSRFQEPIKAMGREFDLQKKYHRRLDRDYCASWTVTDHVSGWKTFDAILSDISDVQINDIYIEVINIVDKKVELLGGSVHNLLRLSVAFPGLFPPVENRSLSSIYYSQIPLLNLQKSDLVHVNLRNTKMLPVNNANQILVQSLELRSGELARKILADVSPCQIISREQIRIDNISAFINSLETMKGNIKEQLKKNYHE